MELLVDLFGYLSIVVHGLTIIAQSMTLGGVLFLVFLARPQAWLLGRAGAAIQADTARIAAWSAIGLAVAEGITVAMQAAVLTATIDLPVENVLQAAFALAGLVKIAMALLLAATLFGFGAAAPAWLLLPMGAVVLAAATMTTHAAARLELREPLLAASALHQLGAAIWIGGIPAFISALARVHDAASWETIGTRFSRMSMLGVLCIAISGAAMAYVYVGDWAGFYGTAYGVMVSAKIAMFAGLLGLGLGNFLLIGRLRRQRSGGINRLRRFAEVEIGVGFTLFFAAASLTSVPPAVDLPNDRVSFHEIVDRNWPVWPRLTSPDRDTLTLPALQAKLDAEAAREGRKPPPAFVPGSGELPSINAADIAWSEYNHHWAGIFVLAIGILALFNQMGLRVARHWPLLFLGLAGFLFFRSDPESWPLGSISFLDSLRDVEVLQHRFFVLLIVVFGLFEWRVRLTGRTTGWQPLVFPLVSALGGAALLTHSHAIANIKQQLLVEITHTPLALAGVAAGWARWLELRLGPPGNRIAGWVWPVCFMFVGVLLLLYREA
ncbi:MAG: copper resistance protein [Rhodospirillales bacterium 70-18]|nr:CopD family protein [Rhodospirillales bacterium]OJY72326.1 MAG: copper resistance protein [Rhodospirillales bacterium 70-18]